MLELRRVLAQSQHPSDGAVGSAVDCMVGEVVVILESQCQRVCGSIRDIYEQSNGYLEARRHTAWPPVLLQRLA